MPPPLHRLIRCYTRAKSGYKYYSTVVRDIATVSTIALCSARCSGEQFCNSFSFRRSGSQDRDNCLLSSLETAAILPASDLVRDNSWDVWSQKSGCNSQEASSFPTTRPGIESLHFLRTLDKTSR